MCYSIFLRMASNFKTRETHPRNMCVVCVIVTDQLSDGLTDVVTENKEVICVSVCLQI